MNRMILPLRRYFELSGRSSRSEFWLFVLLVILALLVCGTLDSLLGLGGGYDRTVLSGPYGYATEISQRGGLISGVFALVMIIPLFAVAVRRLHDSDHSGWWLLIGLVPVAGGVVLLIFYLLAGSAGPNRFGPPRIV